MRAGICLYVEALLKYTEIKSVKNNAKEITFCLQKRHYIHPDLIFSIANIYIIIRFIVSSRGRVMAVTRHGCVAHVYIYICIDYFLFSRI